MPEEDPVVMVPLTLMLPEPPNVRLLAFVFVLLIGRLRVTPAVFVERIIASVALVLVSADPAKVMASLPVKSRPLTGLNAAELLVSAHALPVLLLSCSVLVAAPTIVVPKVGFREAFVPPAA